MRYPFVSQILVHIHRMDEIPRLCKKKNWAVEVSEFCNLFVYCGASKFKCEIMKLQALSEYVWSSGSALFIIFESRDLDRGEMTAV